MQSFLCNWLLWCLSTSCQWHVFSIDVWNISNCCSKLDEVSIVSSYWSMKLSCSELRIYSFDVSDRFRHQSSSSRSTDLIDVYYTHHYQRHYLSFEGKTEVCQPRVFGREPVIVGSLRWEPTKKRSLFSRGNQCSRGKQCRRSNHPINWIYHHRHHWKSSLNLTEIDSYNSSHQYSIIINPDYLICNLIIRLCISFSSWFSSPFSDQENKDRKKATFWKISRMKKKKTTLIPNL
jgi:hypothetical protein